MLVTQFVAHDAKVSYVYFSPDGKDLVTTSEDQTAKVWQLPETAITSVRLRGNEVGPCEFSPDGSSLAFSNLNGDLSLWKIGTAPPQRIWRCADKSPLAFFADGKRIVFARPTAAVQVVDIPSMKNTQLIPERREPDEKPGRFTLQDSRNVSGIAIAPDEKALVVTYRDGMVRSVRVDNANATTHAQQVFHRSVLANHRESAAIAGMSGFRFWDGATREWAGPFVPVKYWVHALAFTPDGKTLVLACDDAIIRLWDVPSAKIVGELYGHRRNVIGVAVSRDGRTVASSSDDRTLRLWCLKTRQEICTLVESRSQFHHIRFSPAGDALALALNRFEDGYIFVCNGRPSKEP